MPFVGAPANLYVAYGDVQNSISTSYQENTLDTKFTDTQNSISISYQENTLDTKFTDAQPTFEVKYYPDKVKSAKVVNFKKA